MIRGLIRGLYSGLWYLLVPILFSYLWWRGRVAPGYRQRWAERMAWGYRQQRLKQSIWVHAVSVGETLAAAPMIEALLSRYPHIPLVITTTTPTGSERVTALFGDRVTHVYCPWELPGALRRFLHAFDPRLVIVLETELWPNMVKAVDDYGARVILMNGRLSAKSYRGYRRFASLMTPMMQRFDALAVQTAVEAERFIALGARTPRVHVIGSVKFDIHVNPAIAAQAAALRQEWGSRGVWLAASTHPGEDAPVLAAHQKLLNIQPDALLVLVPRHPERFDTVAAMIRSVGLNMARRSRAEAVFPDTHVYLADTMGEQPMLFGTCDVAFVGGSLVPVGGHNVLEPAARGKPIITGPYLHNFTAIADLLESAGGMTVVTDESVLPKHLLALMGDKARQQRQGAAAEMVVNENRGALERGMGLIDQYLAETTDASSGKH